MRGDTRTVGEGRVPVEQLAGLLVPHPFPGAWDRFHRQYRFAKQH